MQRSEEIKGKRVIMTKIGFIGAGNMGGAIMKGILGSDIEDVEISAFDTDNAKLAELEKVGVKKCGTAGEVCGCDIVFLAVKPQVFEDVLVSFRDSVKEDTVYVSIAAGITADFIRKTLGKPQLKVVLVMPNTPLLLGEGATAIGQSENVPEEKFRLICSIFEQCGKAFVIPESKMKEVIAVNSSSPAFIYLFAKGFIEYGISQGFDENTAKELFSQALIGSAKMITDSGYSVDELIKMVSSPGGTTLAGLDKLYAGELVKVVNNACDACTKRAYELSK